MEGESSESQGWCNRFEDVLVDPKHIDDFERIFLEQMMARLRAMYGSTGSEIMEETEAIEGLQISSNNKQL
ncbi:hypothetical protein Dimus_026748 [Dionaea muscipula]